MNNSVAKVEITKEEMVSIYNFIKKIKNAIEDRSCLKVEATYKPYLFFWKTYKTIEELHPEYNQWVWTYDWWDESRECAILQSDDFNIPVELYTLRRASEEIYLDSEHCRVLELFRKHIKEYEE